MWRVKFLHRVIEKGEEAEEIKAHILNNNNSQFSNNMECMQLEASYACSGSSRRDCGNNAEDCRSLQQLPTQNFPNWAQHVAPQQNRTDKSQSTFIRRRLKDSDMEIEYAGHKENRQ